MSVQHGAWGVASCNFQPPLSKNPRSAAGYLGKTLTIFKLGSETSPFHEQTIRRDLCFVRDIFTAGETSKERGVLGKLGR